MTVAQITDEDCRHPQTLNDLAICHKEQHNFRATESRRDQEEGGELDSHEEASPEEIKSREVVLGRRVGLL